MWEGRGHWDREFVQDVGRSSRVEWLETNGLGGYAMSTIIGMNTRRYHGLLAAPLRPPVDRHLFLSKLEDSVSVGGKTFDLSCNRYAGVLHPDGFRRQQGFVHDLFPEYHYEAGPLRLEKTLVLIHGSNTLVVRYVLRGGGRFRLRVLPLLAFRRHHTLTHENASMNHRAEVYGDRVSFKLYETLPAMSLHFFGGGFRESGVWIKNMEYAEEEARGLDYTEDLYNPGEIVWEGESHGTYFLTASIDPGELRDPRELLDAETSRRIAAGREAAQYVSSEWNSAFARSPDVFIGRRGVSGTTVIAGYPWFADWGRDAMISLPGLTLATRRFQDARSILITFSEYLNQGLIPNSFLGDGGSPEYNSADATFWLIHALEEYRRASGDLELVRTLYPALTEVIKWHIKGTHFGIRMDPADHLIATDDPTLGLTWMDAKIGDRAVTPRSGKPVEINALWYRALSLMGWWTGHLGGRFNPYVDLARSVRDSFRRRFWFEKGQYLFDVVDGREGDDASMRPNQLFAVALAEDLISHTQAGAVLARVREELLTPYGLRTLSRKHPLYRGSCSGDQAARDAAYHQGTVWPWLLGVYADALIRVEGRKPQTLTAIRSLLEPFSDHLRVGGIGSVSEIFDGDPPHEPRGCPAQAWSVAELLRISAMAHHIERA